MNIQKIIDQKLTSALSPTHLQVINESHNHHVPANSETHFKVIIASEKFVGLKKLQQHRLINETLKEELSGSVHALSITSKTPAEWKESDLVNSSPNCLG